VTRMNALIEKSLTTGNVLVLFPEGTSWNGSEVLPFKSSLLEPIVGAKHPLAVGYLSYALEDGDAANDVCYWGDATFFPHLVNMMTKNHIRSRVSFAPVQLPANDRKELAQQLHAEISRLAPSKS
jgi:1-acyl-sn-glycerol-3-phosphate acyltransferase